MLMAPDTRSIVLSEYAPRARERESHFVSNKHPVDSFRCENRHATVSRYKKAFRMLGLGPTAATMFMVPGVLTH